MNLIDESKSILVSIPPPVPSIRGDGNFDYINDEHEREMLENAFTAISITNLWDFVSKDIESFMWSNANEIKIILKKMEELGYYRHSGASFGWTMRAMQYLAEHGERNFKANYYKING